MLAIMYIMSLCVILDRPFHMYVCVCIYEFVSMY